VCIDPNFSSSRLSLVDRGIVFAIAHVRGGGEKGQHAWYKAAGKYLHKKNTFRDFVDCASALLDLGIARPSALSCEGRSAGGLLVGASVNLAPELFCAALAGVPFVDTMVSMCDASIPLTVEEWEEWGNPVTLRRAHTLPCLSPSHLRAAAEVG
jgi:oligopeptidase B